MPKVGGKRRGAGRPRKADSKTASIMVRLSPETKRALERVAAAAHKSPSGWSHDTIVAAINELETSGMITPEERATILDEN